MPIVCLAHLAAKPPVTQKLLASGASYRSQSEMDRLMTEALPPSFVVHNPAPEMVHLLAREVSRDGWGQNSVLDRLLDVLLVDTLRQWLNGRDDRDANLLGAPRDTAVRTVTEAIHAHPEADCTIDSLARTAGIPRAALTRRFASVVGVSQMRYLTRWRLSLGADLLDRTDRTVEAITHQVGCGSLFSFSAAFKKRSGCSPQSFRVRDFPEDEDSTANHGTDFTGSHGPPKC